VRFLLGLILLIGIPYCLGQTTTGKAESMGSCSPAVTGTNNQITINCTGISRDQAAGLREVLNRILANRLDTKAVMAKLDALERSNTTSGVLLSPSSFALPVLEIGDSGKGFRWEGPHGVPIMNLVEGSQLTIESDNGRIKVSTNIRDKNGALVAELIRNEWKVSPSAWDKNYNDDALEVRNAEGRVVLQVRVTDHSIQLQGEWRDEHGQGIRLVKCANRQTGAIDGCILILGAVDSPDQQIEPIFKYPSQLHPGELETKKLP
jgi:hypothetical protein